jgi:DNA-binding transcriptional LysR family regulator
MLKVKISLRQLKIFEALVKTKGYTRAASMLHLTQPAVSMQIKHLEDYVGKPLFERHSKTIVLTDAGKYCTNIAVKFYRVIKKCLLVLKR